MKTDFYLRLDPEQLRKLRRPLRDLCWSLPILLGEKIAAVRHKRVDSLIDLPTLEFYQPSRGEPIMETAVTRIQLDLLIHSLRSLASHSGDVAEIGSWRGITTLALAQNTTKTVYAIDPHPIGHFEGVEEAYEAFQKRVATVSNIRYIRKCSGEAFRQCSDQAFSMVFVDAMHDFVSANFDLTVWSTLITTGGFLALHDVDDHPGVNLALQRALRRKKLLPWGYCPNLIVLKKL